MHCRLHLLARADLTPHSSHAILIDALRAAAALEVAAAHLRALAFPGYKLVREPTWWFQVLALLTGFAHQAVVVFFVISGYLVGGSLLNRLGQPHCMRDYAIDRATRLWTVLLPTFCACLCVGLALGQLQPLTIDFASASPYSLSTLLANLFGLQTLAAPQFAGNFPLWSLANETWYYILFPLLVVSWTARDHLRRLLGAASALSIAVVLPSAMVLYFSIWLLGAAASRWRLDTDHKVRAFLLALLLGVSITERLFGNNDDLTSASFLQDGLLSVCCVLVLASVQGQPVGPLLHAIAPLADRLARCAFTLYVIHVPLIMAVLQVIRSGARLAPDNALHGLLYLALLASLVGLAYLFHLPFEGKTSAVRAAVKTALARRLCWRIAAKELK